MLKKLFSYILILVVMISTTGFTLSSHYCGGKKVKSEISFSKHELSCGMVETPVSCSNKTTLKSNCCKNTYQNIVVEDNYTATIISTVAPITWATLMVTFIFHFELEFQIEKIFIKDYSPPPLVKDIPVLIQSFLI